MPDYDIITVGGGLGGAALGKAMAEGGYRVLIVEREKQFKDRVRGEWLAPWGVAEAQALGIYALQARPRAAVSSVKTDQPGRLRRGTAHAPAAQSLAFPTSFQGR